MPYALQLVLSCFCSHQHLGSRHLLYWNAEAPTAGPDSKSNGHARNYVYLQGDYVGDIRESCNAQQQSMADKDFNSNWILLIIHIYDSPCTNNTEAKANL